MDSEDSPFVHFLKKVLKHKFRISHEELIAGYEYFVTTLEILFLHLKFTVLVYAGIAAIIYFFLFKIRWTY